jgi:hypothetical protein
VTDKKVRDVSDVYELARFAANGFKPGEYPDMQVHMRAAYQHGFAAAMLRVVDTGLVPHEKLIEAFFKASSSENPAP